VYLGRQGTGAGSLRLAARTVGLADQLGVRAVLTNAVRYADPAQHRLADVLDAARLLRPVDPRRLDGGERRLKDPAAMTAAADRIAQAVRDDPARAVRLLAETEAAGQSCTLTPADLGLGRPHFPEPAVVGAGPERGSAMRLLRQRCETGMVARGLDTDESAVRQLRYELDVIGRLGFEGYFLAVAQVVADTRALGIRVAARGSGSMVNHALFVASANPLGHRLLFERFLSERRTSLPDIDLDVESERRLEVYDAIIERFGKERTAVTGMPETYRARHAPRLPVKFSVLKFRAGSWRGRSTARERRGGAPHRGHPPRACRPAEAGSDCDHSPMSANHWLVVRVVMSSSSWTEVSGVIARPGMALIA
jgi:error-prone DNA polymerase